MDRPISPKVKYKTCSGCGTRKLAYTDGQYLVNIKHKDLYLQIDFDKKTLTVLCTKCGTKNTLIFPGAVLELKH